VTIRKRIAIATQTLGFVARLTIVVAFPQAETSSRA
jgi:hypothetical protein